MINPEDMTKKELKIAAQAVECSTFLMKYCAVHKFGDDCQKCVFRTEEYCAISGAPYEYKPIRPNEEGNT